MIATTLNMHIDVLSKITETADRLGVSRREIIVQLLMRLMNDLDSYQHGFKAVTYQQDDLKEFWHCFHIRFKENENEYFVDLRKLCKFSVSCLVAMAVKKYLIDLIDEHELKIKEVDNYPFYTGYALFVKEIDGIISCDFFWGIPIEHIKTLID